MLRMPHDTVVTGVVTRSETRIFVENGGISWHGAIR